MGIVNRSLDTSEKKYVVQQSIQVEGVTAARLPLGVVPFTGRIIEAKTASTGVSGSPYGYLEVDRFIVGTGMTSISGLGATTPIRNYSLSGASGFSLVGATSALVQVEAQDVLMLNVPAQENTSSDETVVTVVIEALEDIKAVFGETGV